jgi:ankyrin repeat protein
MTDIWEAALEGDLIEVQRLVGQDPGLLNAKYGGVGFTPLIAASMGGHVNVARWLVDKGAPVDEQTDRGWTAMWCASFAGQAPAVRLLVEEGADPTIATTLTGSTPLTISSEEGYLTSRSCAHCSASPAPRRTSTTAIATAGRRCGGPASVAMGG